MNYQTKRALKDFAIFLVMIGVSGALIALCNHRLRINGWSTNELLPIVLIVAIYVSYKLWRRLYRCL